MNQLVPNEAIPRLVSKARVKLNVILQRVNGNQKVAEQEVRVLERAIRENER